MIFTDVVCVCFGLLLNVERTLESKGRELIIALQRAAVLSIVDVEVDGAPTELDQLKEAVVACAHSDSE